MLIFTLLLLSGFYVKNWLDPVIKPAYSTHSVATVIKNTLFFVASNVRKLLYNFIKQNLDWNRTGRQNAGNKDNRKACLQERYFLH